MRNAKINIARLMITFLEIGLGHAFQRQDARGHTLSQQWRRFRHRQTMIVLVQDDKVFCHERID